jgi:hypothetical protein
VIVWLGRDVEPQDHERNYRIFEMWDPDAFGDGDRSAKMAFDLVTRLSGAYYYAGAALEKAKAMNTSGREVSVLDVVRAALSQHEDIHVFLNRKLTPPEEEPWLALGRLCSRPWFHRVWVFQEVALSKEAVMACGKSRIP